MYVGSPEVIGGPRLWTPPSTHPGHLLLYLCKELHNSSVKLLATEFADRGSNFIES
jgi:hypothetical protein